MKIIHVITGLDDGGAEAVLYRLCVSDKENTHIVVSLQDEGKYGKMLADSGIIVHCLNIPKGTITFKGFSYLLHILRECQPDVVQTWMYHADLIGGVVSRFGGIRNIVWGLHHTTLELGSTKMTTMLVVGFNALLSRWIPSRIVSCSNQGVLFHKRIGYPESKFRVVYNGHNLSEFTIDPEKGVSVRKVLDIPVDVPLLGMIARYDPQKDHRNLLQSILFLKEKKVKFKCLLIGAGMTEENVELYSLIEQGDLNEHVMLLGPRNDIPAIMNALDLHILSSYGEALPNVLCEAMACGTPCVTTDVGDSKIIVDQTGWVVPPKNPESLAQAIVSGLKEKQRHPYKWQQRSAAARNRILEHFNMTKMIHEYMAVWSESV